MLTSGLLLLFFQQATTGSQRSASARIEVSYAEHVTTKARHLFERSVGLPAERRSCRHENSDVFFCYSVPRGEEQFWVDALSDIDTVRSAKLVPLTRARGPSGMPRNIPTRTLVIPDSRLLCNTLPVVGGVPRTPT